MFIRELGNICLFHYVSMYYMFLTYVLLGHPILLCNVTLPMYFQSKKVWRTYEYKFMLNSSQKNLRFEMYKEMPFFHMLFIQEFETLWNIYLE